MQDEDWVGVGIDGFVEARGGSGGGGVCGGGGADMVWFYFFSGPDMALWKPGRLIQSYKRMRTGREGLVRLGGSGGGVGADMVWC